MKSVHSRVFLDTNPIIYLLDGIQPYAQKTLAFIKDCISCGGEFYTSTITDAEFLIKPFQKGDMNAVATYREFLAQLDVLKVFINDEIAESAARIRCEYDGIKLADALQIAAAVSCGCDAFLTNDAQLRQIRGLDVLFLSELQHR